MQIIHRKRIIAAALLLLLLTDPATVRALWGVNSLADSIITIRMQNRRMEVDRYTAHQQHLTLYQQQDIQAAA